MASKKNPFGDDLPKKEKINPFGEVEDDGGVAGAADRIEHAARKIRLLRLQIGAEGMTLSATRDLIDELTASLDAMTRALRQLSPK
jgi:flagellin-like hook-associated protein FlgL